MSKRRSSARRSPSQGRIKKPQYQYNKVIQYQYFEMLERIKQERLQPEVQINIAQSICVGLDNMGSSEFSQFDYQRFIYEITDYHWNNNTIVMDFLKQAIDKTLRLKYEYVDKYQHQIKQQQQAQLEAQQEALNWIEQSIRSNFTFGQRQSSDEETLDSNSSMLKSVYEQPQMTPQRQMMVGSLRKINEEEGRRMFESCFTPNRQSFIIQEQQANDSKMKSSKQSMLYSTGSNQ